MVLTGGGVQRFDWTAARMSHLGDTGICWQWQEAQQQGAMPAHAPGVGGWQEKGWPQSFTNVERPVWEYTERLRLGHLS